jgi:hypothetical protein
MNREYGPPVRLIKKAQLRDAPEARSTPCGLNCGARMRSDIEAALGLVVKGGGRAGSGAIVLNHQAHQEHQAQGGRF